MAGGSSPTRGHRTSPVRGAKTAPQTVEAHEAKHRGVSKLDLYIPSCEQAVEHAPDGALTHYGLGGSQLASPESSPKIISGGTAAETTAVGKRRASTPPNMDTCTEECSNPMQAQDEKPTDRIVRRRPGKLSIKPLGTWDEAISPKRIEASKAKSLLQRRSSLPSLKIDCSCQTPTPSTKDNTPSCPRPEPSRESGSFFDFYDLLPDVLGRGSFGVVRRGVRKTDGKKVAVKIMASIDPEVTMVAQQEYELLRGINHPFIVQAFDIFYSTTCTELVLDYFHGNNLEDVLKWSPSHSLSESDSTLLFVKLLHAIAYLHKLGIIHRDVKPQNILVSADLQDLRLVDFNSARRETKKLWSMAFSPTGTCMYAAPEVVGGQAADASSDVWSAGLCCHLMVVGKLPQRRGRDVNFHTFRKEATTSPISLTSSKWQGVSEPFKSALRRCLDLDHYSRPAAADLLKEECFSAANEATSQLLAEHAST